MGEATASGAPEWTPAKLAPWLWLAGRRYVGPAVFRALITALGSPEAVHWASDQEIRRVLESEPGIRKSLWTRALKSITNGRAALSESMARAGAELEACAKAGAVIMTLDDPYYPALLRRRRSVAPPILYAKGRLETGTDRAVAVVGTRGATDAGLAAVRRFASTCASRGWTVVSGGAAGVDRAAHEGALAVGGETIAVLGCGIDRVYPRENLPLFQQLFDHGLVVTEYPPGTRPAPTNLKKRNKLTAGFADAVVLGECPEGSGTLNAARAGREQGTRIFALPLTEPGSERVKGAVGLLARGEASELKAADRTTLEAELSGPAPSPPALVDAVRRAFATTKARSTRGKLTEAESAAWEELRTSYEVSVKRSKDFPKLLDALADRLLKDSWLTTRSLRVRPPKAVLFDLDGVLVGVHSLLVKTLLEAAASEETHVEPGAMEALIGFHPKEAMKRLQAPDAVYREFQERYAERYVQEFERLPDVERAVRSFSGAGVKLGVVTTQPRSRARDALARAQLEDAIDSLIAWNDVGRRKPAPDGIIKALEQLGVNPDRGLYVGDGTVDTEAGRRAGVTAGLACWDRPLGPGMLCTRPNIVLARPSELAELVSPSG